MPKKILTITAGSLLIQSELPVREASPAQLARAARSMKVSEAQKLANQKRSWQQLEMLLAVNFPTRGSGIVGVATFDDDHLPLCRKECQRRFAYARRKLRLARLAEDLPEPVVVWAPEILTAADRRWHVHFVVDSTGHDYDTLRRCWPYGTQLDLKGLRVDREKNHQTLAKYMAKELRECQEYESRPGLHGWSCTRNAKRPEVDVQIVDGPYELTPPEGCEILDRGLRGAEGAEFPFFKCLIPL